MISAVFAPQQSSAIARRKKTIILITCEARRHEAVKLFLSICIETGKRAWRLTRFREKLQGNSRYFIIEIDYGSSVYLAVKEKKKKVRCVIPVNNIFLLRALQSLHSLM